eukprot:Seg3707.2 transcript_id=Seg3707.2/GoldUCD/mRNA.D3Y31 product="Proline-rich AKT1 substrate 1" protein_id=Seg3707.2/GoldUCD/D3Y31
MAKLGCKCLNIVLNIQDGESEEIKGTELLGQDENNKTENDVVDLFFKGNLMLVKLAFAGVEVQQKLLVKDRSVGDYKVFKCVNCDISTHAIHKYKGLERVVASKDLEDELSCTKMRESEDYSAVFKIILKKLPVDPNESNYGTGSHARMFQRSLSDANSKVNEIVKKYLSFEEDAMQERIRIFTEQQKVVFRQLQDKANSDKQNFLSVINRKEENVLQTSISDAMKETRLSKGDSIDSDTDDPLPNLPQIRGKKVRPHRSIPITSSSLQARGMPSRVLSGQTSTSVDSGQRSRLKKRSKSQNEDDTLFDLDGFHESRNCEPFFESDEDSSGDSSSLDNSGVYSNMNRGMAGDRIYATSVPVSVPMFRPSERGTYGNASFEDSEPPPSPDRMAESIKALARSLHDSTSIFGELPGPRYNTMR